MRRLFIIRKDLHLSSGKLSAMVGHCCEAYWTRILRNASEANPVSVENGKVNMLVKIDSKVWFEYALGIFTKTICEAKNKNHLMKIVDEINEYNNEILAKASIDKNVETIHELKKGIDYDFINDKCLTELKPENEDGTTTIGIWFKPLPDDVAHLFSKKYHLYVAEDEKLRKENEELKKRISELENKKQSNIVDWDIEKHGLSGMKHQPFGDWN